MSIKHLLLAGIAAAILSQPASAEPIADDAELGALYTPNGLTADLAARRAREASPAVWRRVAEVEATIANLDAAKTARIPQLSTKLSYTRLSPIDPVALPIGAGAPGGITFPVLLDSYVAQAQIVVPLSDYVLRHPHSIGAAKLGTEAARVSTRATALGAANSARHAYYEWIRARLQLVVSQRQLAQVKGNLARVRDVVDAGRAPRAELLRIESQEAETEQLVDRLRLGAKLREEVLRLQIGARPDEPLTIGEDVRFAVAAPVTGSVDELARLANAQRLDLRALRIQIEANEQRRQVERANLLPKLSAFGTAEYSNPNQRIFPADDKFTGTWAAGLQITWTLHDALLSRTSARRIAADTRALQADHEALSRDARIAVISAQQHIDNAKRAITTTAKGLDAAEEGYRVRRALLAAERATAIELVDAETELTRARIAALDARIDLRIALADFDYALGADR